MIYYYYLLINNFFLRTSCRFELTFYQFYTSTLTTSYLYNLLIYAKDRLAKFILWLILANFAD